jgi:hypothetical protein
MSRKSPYSKPNGFFAGAQPKKSRKCLDIERDSQSNNIETACHGIEKPRQRQINRIEFDVSNRMDQRCPALLATQSPASAPECRQGLCWPTWVMRSGKP